MPTTPSHSQLGSPETPAFAEAQQSSLFGYTRNRITAALLAGTTLLAGITGGLASRVATSKANTQPKTTLKAPDQSVEPSDIFNQSGLTSSVASFGTFQSDSSNLGDEVKYIQPNTPTIKRDKKTISEWYRQNPAELGVGINNVHKSSKRNIGKLTLRVVNNKNRYTLALKRGAKNKMLGAYVSTFDFDIREGMTQRSYLKVIKFRKIDSGKYVFNEKYDSADTTKAYRSMSALFRD